MGPIGFALRTELRRRWRAWLAVSLLLAIFAGITAATAAGARRTDTAYERLLRVEHPFDQFLLGVGPHPMPYGPFAIITLDQLRAMKPLVVDDLTAYFFDGPNGNAGGIASPDPRMDRAFNGAKVVAGRLPRPDRADEAAVPVAIADSLHARVGGTITLQLVKDAFSDNPKTVPVTFRVAGIIAVPGEFPPESDLGPPRVHLTAAFYEKYQSWGAFPYTLVRLRHGEADLPAFRAALAKAGGGKGVIGYTNEALTRNVERSFHLQAVALALFALCLAIVTALVLGQTLGRQAMAEGVDYPALRALGMTRRQLFWLGVTRSAVVAGIGVLLAIPIALLLSPLLPTGLARAADPDHGFHADLTAVLGGALIALAVLILLTLIPAARAARLAERDEVFGRAESGAERTSRTVTVVTGAGASASAVVGMRLALEPGRGRTSVPVRTTIAGVALAVAALTIALSFGASLRYLLATPRLYGLVWGADVTLQDDPTTNARYAKAIAIARADPHVDLADSIGLGAPFLIDGVQADGMAVASGDNTFLPPVESGRAPRTATEIALGPKTLRRIHKSIGDSVSVAVVGVAPERFTIVGRIVVPTVGHTANLGEGSVVTFDALYYFFGDRQYVQTNDEFVVRFKEGVNQSAARAHLQGELASTGAEVAPPTTPGDLLNFGRNQQLPYILSGLLALLALGTLAHALVTSINRRRRDLAICKTLGFTRGDVARAVAWQSSTFIVVSLAFGLLAGVIAGRWLWSVYANQLGILSVPRVPAWTLILMVPAAGLLANGLALLPARSAAGTRPAIVLRAE
jgi:ABC-type lipoprotein release transport system permease subunit